MLKQRIILLGYTIIVIAAGLLSRSSFVPDDTFVGIYSGDTLWALMVCLGFGIILFQRSVWVIFFSSLLFSFAIELSQLYHSSWIDSIRSSKLGGLILGFGFKWSDLLCYICGCLIGSVILLVHKNSVLSK